MEKNLSGSNRRLLPLILISFVLFASAVVLRLGIAEVEAPDSQGRPMGFNDPLSWEHYGMMVQHFSPAKLLSSEYWYEWLLLAMHAIGLILLGRQTTTAARGTRWFFAGQWLLFPLGVPSMLLVPFIVGNHLLSNLGDREGFVDMPFILVVAQGSWLWASFIIAAAFRGSRLGVVDLWRSLRRRMSSASPQAATS